MASQSLSDVLNPQPAIHFIGQIGLVAALYFLTGKLGLYLSTDNEYSTLIWPPSGIALAAVLLLGYRIWPALVLGAFATNVSFDTSGASLIDIISSQPQNYFIALGNTSQALLAAYILKVSRCFPNPLTRLADILKFYILAGPIACLTAATVGASSLFVFGIIPAADFANTWTTWWIGDTNGVLLLTPLIIAWSMPRDNNWVLRRIWVTIGFTLVIMILAVFVYHSRKWNEDDLNQRIAFDNDIVARALQDEIEKAVDAVTGLAGLISLVPDIDRKQFSQFAADRLSHTPGLAALSWNPSILAADREAHERRLSADYGKPRTITERAPDGQLRPAATADQYVYVAFIEPVTGNDQAIGFNTLSNPARRQSLEKAAENASAVMTSRISLVQEGDEDEYGALLFAPVMKDNTVRGFATGVVRIPNIVRQALGITAKSGLIASLEDLSVSGDAEQLFFGGLDVSLTPPRLRQALARATVVNAADRMWLLTLTPTDTYILAYRSKTSWLVMLAVWISAAVLGILFLVLTGRHFETERLVAERTEELVLANRIKSDFLANMSHEIRTPMNGVLGMLDLIQDTKLSDEQNRLVTVAHQSAKSLLVVINDILDFSRLQKGDLLVRAEPMNLASAISGTLELMKHVAQKKGLSLHFEASGDTKANILFDQARLQQVLFNLVGNAIKFTEEGMVTVSLDLGATHNDHIAATLTITDTGIGIAPADQKRIFDRFVQVDTTSSRKYQGTGLGLAISTQLVELLGGSLSLHSLVGQGTSVTLKFEKLPLFSGLLTPHPEEASPAPISTLQSSSSIRKSLSVLVAEDNLVNQMLVQKLLSQHGHMATLASNGKILIERLHEIEHAAEPSARPDLILMDIQMPEMDGVTAARYIRAMADTGIASTPIIALTANALPEQHEEYLAAGMNGCINKPIQFAEFYGTIANVLGLTLHELAERRRD